MSLLDLWQTGLWTSSDWWEGQWAVWKLCMRQSSPSIRSIWPVMYSFDRPFLFFEGKFTHAHFCVQIASIASSIWIDLVQQPLKKDFRGSTLPLETFLPEFPLWCLHRWWLTLLAHLGSHVPLQKHAHWTFFWRISCFLKVQCVDKMHAFMKGLLRSNTLLHCHYWNSFKPYLMCSEAILDTVKCG